MFQKTILIFILIFTLFSCSNKDVEYEPQNKLNPYTLYQEGFEAFSNGDYFFANKKFSEAELNFEKIEFSAKAAIMSSYALYGINFYNQALENLERYLKKYPADKNVMYAHYLIALIHYEQISDEKKDLQPLLDATEKINFFMNKFPESDYTLDLKFKKDLIQNQLAAKELYVAKYYVSTQKWVPAINRLKIIVEKYDLKLPTSEEYETLAGYLLNHHESFPHVNSSIEIEKIILTVLKITSTRIELIHVKILVEEDLITEE